MNCHLIYASCDDEYLTVHYCSVRAPTIYAESMRATSMGQQFLVRSGQSSELSRHTGIMTEGMYYRLFNTMYSAEHDVSSRLIPRVSGAVKPKEKGFGFDAAPASPWSYRRRICNLCTGRTYPVRACTITLPLEVGFSRWLTAKEIQDGCDSSSNVLNPLSFNAKRPFRTTASSDR